jgi:membrane protein implicated in regulation of membrane protease activity
MVGRIVRVKSTDGRQTAFLDGTWWEIRSDLALDDGSQAIVVGTEGIRLLVEEVKGDV